LQDKARAYHAYKLTICGSSWQSTRIDQGMALVSVWTHHAEFLYFRTGLFLASGSGTMAAQGFVSARHPI